VLFIDEIGEMDYLLLNKLLKVLEDKRVFFESSYYDSDNSNIPRYIKKLFKEGAPADFILIGATTRYPEELNPALRSRCVEVYFEPLSPGHIKEIVINSAQKLQIAIDTGVAELISRYTIEGRKANNILADAYGLALYLQKKKKGRPPKKLSITKEHVLDVLQSSRISPYVGIEAKDKQEIGRVLGLGVSGFIGTVIEIEAVSFLSNEKGKGNIRFNETAGSMAKDSVFNAASVFRKISGKKLSDYDCHVNVVGGGNIDGPSAGLAITLALLSAVQQIPICQDTAVTGEVSIQGLVKPVGGIPEKIYGARQSGMRKILIPKDNQKDIPADIDSIEIVTVETVTDALKQLIDKESNHNNKIVI
jgi:ATP-dependent Lon protease